MITPTPPPTDTYTEPPLTVDVHWTVPPFRVVFGVVWRTGLAILACYGLVFVGIMLTFATLAETFG